MAKRGSFYEEDESEDALAAAFDRGPVVLSSEPTEGERGWTETLQLPGSVGFDAGDLVPCGGTRAE